MGVIADPLRLSHVGMQLPVSLAGCITIHFICVSIEWKDNYTVSIKVRRLTTNVLE